MEMWAMNCAIFSQPVAKQQEPTTRQKHPVSLVGRIRPHQVISRRFHRQLSYRSSGYPGIPNTLVACLAPLFVCRGIFQARSIEFLATTKLVLLESEALAGSNSLAPHVRGFVSICIFLHVTLNQFVKRVAPRQHQLLAVRACIAFVFLPTQSWNYRSMS